MLRVLIADDEEPARKRLRKLLQPLTDASRLEIIAEAEDGQAVLDFLAKDTADLLFLDIRMPALDGFGVVERLSPDNRPAVVFTTAYDAYAIQAFDANAIDYLLKPISRERLEKAVSKVENAKTSPETRQLSESRIAELLDWMDAQVEATKERDQDVPKEYMRQISIPYRDRILIIPIQKLLSAEINDGITRLHVLDEDAVTGKTRIRQHIVNYTLDQLEAHLNPDHFMRIHRSAIIQIDHIKELVPWFSGRYKIILEGHHEVIASRERSKILKDRLMI